MPSPEVFLPGPFVTIPSSGPAVGSALAAYPRWLIAEFEQEVLYERGLAQVGFGVLPLLSLYFLLSKRLTVCLTWFDLVRATAAHRTPTGLKSKGDRRYPGFRNPGLKSAIPLGLTSLVFLTTAISCPFEDPKIPSGGQRRPGGEMQALSENTPGEVLREANAPLILRACSYSGALLVSTDSINGTEWVQETR